MIAQLLDGIVLSLAANAVFYICSSGQIYAVWVSPMFPFYLMQPASGYVASVPDWIWGGYFFTFSPGFIADLHIAYPSPILFVIYALYYSFFHHHYGQTIGKMMKGLVVLSATGKKLTLGQSFFRWLGYAVSLIPLGAGIWAIPMNEISRSWHDDLSNSQVWKFLPD